MIFLFRTPGVCGASAVCTNLPGSFSCACTPPLVGRPPKEPCKDACAEVDCGRHSKCKIEGIEPFCVCDEGWTYNPKNIAAGRVTNIFVYLVLIWSTVQQFWSDGKPPYLLSNV